MRAKVIHAAKTAGLLRFSFESFVSGLSGIIPLDQKNVPDLTPKILDLTRQAYKVANANDFSTGFLVSFAFGGLGMMLCWLVAQNDGGVEKSCSGTRR